MASVMKLPAEARIHASLSVARRERGMTQQQLAMRMRERGFNSWYSVTVSRVELGMRTLKLPEIITLALILGVALDLLVTAPPHAIRGCIRESGGAPC
ncbi:hypothetical protein B7C42_01601 [Nocardia cerradoensis]|uniref:HTH cro/C1-type domain-containing protein n=1 Tax=Nocardia cerradoensis TaxID=85688 RepID=A0A231HD48_9NOCA|nr:helix-turn-helix transcriptional regulator [Nocardia cerradoensis]OXR46627.1 hypothetical protein B7C42_01601 [Nocardia cerradoensis]